MTKRFDIRRAKETARRLREGERPVPLIAKETEKREGDLVISSTKVERV